MKAAVLDDYQGVSRRLADWSCLEGRLELEVFTEPLAPPRGWAPGGGRGRGPAAPEAGAEAEAEAAQEALAARLAPFEALCIMRERTPFGRSLLRRLPRLRLLVTSGMRNGSVDLAAARELGVTVCGTAARGSPAAELAWGLILALARRIPQEDRAVRAGGWQHTVGVSLEGKTLGLLGLGKLGAKMATIGAAFGMRVVAWSQNLTAERCAEVGVELVSKADLFRRADFLSLHVVLGDRTRGLVGTEELALMKPTAFLVNTARAAIVDEAALLDALRRGQIAGAGLDVFHCEPLEPDHPLRSMENVVLTPHLGYVEEDNYRAYFQGYVDALQGFLNGKPVNVLNG